MSSDHFPFVDERLCVLESERNSRGPFATDLKITLSNTAPYMQLWTTNR